MAILEKMYGTWKCPTCPEGRYLDSVNFDGLIYHTDFGNAYSTCLSIRQRPPDDLNDVVEVEALISQPNAEPF